MSSEEPKRILTNATHDARIKLMYGIYTTPMILSDVSDRINNMFGELGSAIKTLINTTENMSIDGGRLTAALDALQQAKHILFDAIKLTCVPQDSTAKKQK